MGAEELKRIFMSLPCIKEVFKINGLNERDLDHEAGNWNLCGIHHPLGGGEGFRSSFIATSEASLGAEVYQNLNHKAEMALARLSSGPVCGLAALQRDSQGGLAGCQENCGNATHRLCLRH